MKNGKNASVREGLDTVLYLERCDGGSTEPLTVSCGIYWLLPKVYLRYDNVQTC